MLTLIDQFGKDFDKNVTDWKKECRGYMNATNEVSAIITLCLAHILSFTPDLIIMHIHTLMHIILYTCTQMQTTNSAHPSTDFIVPNHNSSDLDLSIDNAFQDISFSAFQELKFSATPPQNENDVVETG